MSNDRDTHGAPMDLTLARQLHTAKRISTKPNSYVITENTRKGLVTIRTASGAHIATMRRSTAIRDGLIDSDDSSNRKRSRS